MFCLFSIKEIMEEYSMNFQNDSRMIISQNISATDSHQKKSSQQYKNTLHQKAVRNNNSKGKILKDNQKQSISSIQQIQSIDTFKTPNLGSKREVNVVSTAKFNPVLNAEIIPQSNEPIAVFLGEQIFKTLRDKYYEQNKILTNAAQPLFQFYLARRKHSSAPIAPSLQQMGPAAQRKALLKYEFETILQYNPKDVQYSLYVSAEGAKIDQVIESKVKVYSSTQNNLSHKNKNKAFDHIVVKPLYEPKQKIFTVEQLQAIDRYKLGGQLSEMYQHYYNTQQTYDKLCQYYNKNKEMFAWNHNHPHTVQQNIKMYMEEQFAQLVTLYKKKHGNRKAEGNQLFQFLIRIYKNRTKLTQKINIPLNSFKQYLQIYNIVNMSSLQKTKKQNNSTNKPINKLGHPISCTPLSVLAQPKCHSQVELYNKFPSDPLIQTMQEQKLLRRARYPFQYGVFDQMEEIKIKQRIKINETNKTTNRDKLMHDYLSHTVFSQGFPQSSAHSIDRVIKLLREEDLYKTEVWKELSKVLEQSILVKSHYNKQLRGVIIDYIKKNRITLSVKNSNNQLNSKSNNQESSIQWKEDKILYKQLIEYYSNLSEERRQDQLQKLQKTLRSYEQKEEPLSNNKSHDREIKTIIKQKAIQFLKYRSSNSSQTNSFVNETFSLRKFLNQLYSELCTEQLKATTNSYFRGFGNECPALLRYQFFRAVKEIDPETLERDKNVKSHTWIPPKNTPQSFNYKTHNMYGTVYADKNRGKIDARKEDPKKSKSLWGRNMNKQRENILMKYQDAKECTFQPQWSKKLY